MRDVTFAYMTSFMGTADEFGDPIEHELKVRFNGRAWVEYHPYGSTVAGEHLSEIDDIIEITLDGNEITEDDLKARFGEDRVKVVLSEAFDKAEIEDE